MADRIPDWLPLAALACAFFLGLARTLVLYVHGIRVVVADRRRTPGQMLADLLALLLLLLWVHEVVAYAWPSPIRVLPPWLDARVVDTPATRMAGALMLIAAVVLYGAALWAFGRSWRIGIDRGRPGPLATGGIFAWTRNPIYVSFALLFLGTFLVQGRLVFLVLALGGAAMLHAQVRREERFLAEAYGDAYRAYCARVGRYVPRLRRHG